MAEKPGPKDATVKIRRVLDRLERRSRQERSRKLDVPPEDRMLAITKETGQLIDVLLSALNARNVLEIGMSTGYSALWCAGVVRKNSGRITTIERSARKILRAKKNFSDAGVGRTVRIIKGEATDVLKSLNSKKEFRSLFDFVLIDADKEGVIGYFDMAVPLVRRGGIIMVDNMLYPEKYRVEMARLARHIRRNPQIKTVTCPIGNGEEISVKI